LQKFASSGRFPCGHCAWEFPKLSGLWFFKSPELLSLKAHLPARSFRYLSSLPPKANPLFCKFSHRWLDGFSNFLPQLPLPSQLTASQRFSAAQCLKTPWAVIVFVYKISRSTSNLNRSSSLMMVTCHSSLNNGEWGVVLSAAGWSCHIPKLGLKFVGGVVIVPQLSLPVCCSSCLAYLEVEASAPLPQEELGLKSGLQP
jgi:hypothetical protein